MDVEVDDVAARELLLSRAVIADIQRRGANVRKEASRRASHVSRRWAAAMATQGGTDAEGPYVDISWRRGTHGGEDWRGHFFEFGHDRVPARPALRPALDAAIKD